jgi:hypothetical protein
MAAHKLKWPSATGGRRLTPDNRAKSKKAFALHGRNPFLGRIFGSSAYYDYPLTFPLCLLIFFCGSAALQGASSATI